MDLAVRKFIERVVMDSGLEWVQWSMKQTTTRSTLDRKNGLLIKLTLRHPTTYVRDGSDERSNRHSCVPFDIARHTHWFELRVEDPFFRWGRRVILKINANPESEAYAFLREVYEGLGSVKAISAERTFESRMIALNQALEALVGT